MSMRQTYIGMAEGGAQPNISKEKIVNSILPLPPLEEQHRDLLCGLAKLFPNVFVLDLRAYAPVYDDAFRRQYFLGGHMNPMGYLLTARMVVSYIDYIIRSDMPSFAQVGFINTPWKNTAQ